MASWSERWVMQQVRMLFRLTLGLENPKELRMGEGRVIV
jgi:hypothetical protein